MTFRSEAHRRWYFANKDSGGSGYLESLSSGVGSRADRQGNKDRESVYMRAIYNNPESRAAMRSAEAANWNSDNPRDRASMRSAEYANAFPAPPREKT